MDWFYVDAGQQAGPVTDAQLEELLGSGKIQPDTLVWHEGMANWEPYSKAKAPAIAAPPITAPPLASTNPEEPPKDAVCAECGRMFSIQDMIRHKGSYICAGCKPVFMQKLSEGMAGSWQAGGAGTVSIEQVLARDYDHDLGAYFSRAWDVFKNNIGIMIGATVLVYLTLGAINAVPYINSILALVLTGPLMGGLWAFYLKKIRGLEAGVGDAFSGFGPRFGQMLLGNLVPGILAGLCMLPVIIPIVVAVIAFSNHRSSGVGGMAVGLMVVGAIFALVGICAFAYFTICWLYTLPLVVDKGMSFWPAMSLSRKVVIKHFWMNLLLYIVFSVVISVSVLAFCIGILIGGPVAFAVYACAYDKLFGDMAPQNG